VAFSFIMGISEDIKQDKFKSNHQKALINILYTSNWLTERIRVFLSEAGLTTQQFNVLRILRGSYPTPLSTLKIRERMLDKMSDTSRIVDRLVIKKLVSKDTCASDKRLVDISITERGLALLAELDKTEGTEELLKILKPEEAAQLSDLLDKIRA
jgi:DNA-binding MarR family transcriptional regulator